MDTNKEIGKRIKEVRNNKNISQVDLAKQIGVAKSTLAGYESGYSQEKVKKEKIL